MTPKDKAEELVKSFLQYVPAEEEFELPYAKRCAIIAVDEISNQLEKIVKPEYVEFITKQAVFVDGGVANEAETCDGYEMIEYWEEVKQEIEKL